MALKKLEIPFEEMKGLMQAVDDNLLSFSYSPDCQNFDVSEGILSTCKGSVVHRTSRNTSMPLPAAPYPIKQMLRLENASTQSGIHPIYIIGVMVASGVYRWYAYEFHNGEYVPWGWYELLGQDDTTPTMTELWPYTRESVMYPITGTPHLIVSGDSANKPYKVWYEYYETTDCDKVYAVQLAGNPPAGKYMTFHRDRIWMAGAGNYPNTIYYSNAFDPEDWSTAGETGSIDIVSSESDIIFAIKNIFDDVVVFKRRSMWRIQGDLPSEYSVEQIYSTRGTIYAESVCTNGTYCFFAAQDGIYQYDGLNVKPFLTEEIKNIFPNMQRIKCVINNDKLYVFDRRVTTTGYVGKAILCDIRKKTISVIKMQDIVDVLSYDDAVVYTDGTYIYELKDTALQYNTTDIVAYWYTPESDLGYPNAEKTLTDIYFNGWGTTSAGADGGQVKITVYYKGMNGVQKTKEKTVTLSTTRRQHKVRFTAIGRLFKFKFENVNGSAINLSGITLIAEVAED